MWNIKTAVRSTQRPWKRDGWTRVCLSYQEGKGVWVFASAREFRLHGRSHHGACAYKVHCRKTSYPRNYTPANTQKKKKLSHTFTRGTFKGSFPSAFLLFQPNCVVSQPVLTLKLLTNPPLWLFLDLPLHSLSNPYYSLTPKSRPPSLHTELPLLNSMVFTTQMTLVTYHLALLLIS